MEIEPDERIVEIAPERLRDFKDQPFKIRKDAQMDNLIDSISRYGILNPLIVRPLPEGVYEIISGHRRKYAAEKLGYRKLPVIIRNLKDEDAIISLVDSDLDTNRASISSLLGTLTSLLGEDQGDLKAVLDSAGTLVGSGAGDTQTIKTLLESVRSML